MNTAIGFRRDAIPLMDGWMAGRDRGWKGRDVSGRRLRWVAVWLSLVNGGKQGPALLIRLYEGRLSRFLVSKRFPVLLFVD